VTGRRFAGAVYDWLAAQEDLPARIARQVAVLEDLAQPVLAAHAARLWDEMMHILDRFALALGDTRLPAAELGKACRAYAAWVYCAGAANLAAVALSLPLVLIRDPYLTNSVLSAESYAPMALVILLLLAGLFAVLRKPFARLLCRPWQEGREEVFENQLPTPYTKYLVKLNLWQLIPAAVLLTVSTFLLMSDSFGPISGAPILLISLIAPCVILPLQTRALPQTPDRPAIKREMLISGIRNPILNVIAWITIGSGLTYGYYEGADGTSGSYHIWHEENIFIGVAVILLVILAAELIRRWLRKKSA
jgi:hypothetical protein